MKQNFFNIALVVTFVLSGLAHYLHFSIMLQFIISCIAIIFVAGFLGKATESVAHYAGERVGGFLNATFGNAAELIIAIFLIKNGTGNHDMVKASITGSIIGNMLLVLGLSVLLGGIKFRIQKFNPLLAGHNASLMLLSVIALFVPAVIFSQLSEDEVNVFSLIVAGLLIVSYLLWLFFSMFTHKTELDSNDYVEHEEPNWSRKTSILFLVMATAMVAFVSEWLVGTLEVVSHQLQLSELFVGAFLIAIVGNAAEHSAAILLAMKNKIGAAVEIAVGSSLQIALFVAPVLVFVSFLFGKPMDLVFTTVEIVAIVVASFIAKSISRDGTTTWFEGVLLLVVYIILGITFYLI